MERRPFPKRNQAGSIPVEGTMKVNDLVKVKKGNLYEGRIGDIKSIVEINNVGMPPHQTFFNIQFDEGFAASFTQDCLEKISRFRSIDDD